MKNYEALMEEARFLSKHVKTVWTNYDWNEKSAIAEVRVPKLVFSDDVQVEWMYEDTRTFKYDIDTHYVRECQVKYNDNVYIFEISTRETGKMVTGYVLEVLIPVGDGVGAKKSLFFERICRNT